MKKEQTEQESDSTVEVETDKTENGKKDGGAGEQTKLENNGKKST